MKVWPTTGRLFRHQCPTQSACRGVAKAVYDLLLLAQFRSIVPQHEPLAQVSEALK